MMTGSRQQVEVVDEAADTGVTVVGEDIVVVTAVATEVTEVVVVAASEEEEEGLAVATADTAAVVAADSVVARTIAAVDLGACNISPSLHFSDFCSELQRTRRWYRLPW